MKKFLLFVAMALFTVSVNAEALQIIPESDFKKGVCHIEGDGGSGRWWNSPLMQGEVASVPQDISNYDYIWIQYDTNMNDIEAANLRLGIIYDNYTGSSFYGWPVYQSQDVIFREEPIVGFAIDKSSILEFTTDEENAVKDEYGNIIDIPTKDHPNKGELIAKYVRQIYIQSRVYGFSIDIKGIYLGTEAEFKAARKAAGIKEYTWTDPENVLEGKEMSSYIRVCIGQNSAVALDQPCNGGVENGVATIKVRSKEDALYDNPAFSRWNGSWDEYDPSTWTAENVAPWDTQGFIKFPKKFNANDKISISMEVRADKAISDVTVDCCDMPGVYKIYFADAPALNIGTTWSKYEISERLVSEFGCNADEFGSIGFRLSQIVEENTVYFKNVKVMVSHATEPDHLLVEDLNICKSETNTLPISMNNKDEITAFQFDVVIPQGITLTDVQLGTRKSDSHTVEFIKQTGSNGVYRYRVVGVSLQSAPFSGNEGELVNLVLTADWSIQKGEYSIYIEDIVLTLPSGEKYYPDDISATLTVSESTTGDADGDGQIDVADIVAMVNYIIGKPLTGFIPLAADINGDGEINVFDVMLGINLVLSQGNNARATDIEESSEQMSKRAPNDIVEDKITINDFNISAGETKDMSISLENTTEYVLFQFDLYLPEGITIESYSADLGRLPKSTTISMAQQEDGSYRFISYNMEKRSIVGNSGGIITLRVKASNDFTSDAKTGYFRKVMLSKADATGPTYEEMAFPINGASNIESVKQEKSYDVYDLLGRKVNLPTKGVYIINKKKVLVK